MCNIQVENYKEFLYQKVSCATGLVYTKLWTWQLSQKQFRLKPSFQASATKGYTAHYVIGSESQNLYKWNKVQKLAKLYHLPFPQIQLACWRSL